MRLGRIVYVGLAPLFFSSCNLNLFSLIDQPNGDAQLMSAARACFDRGDFACAEHYYSQISPNNSDTALSEEAFATAASAGLTAGLFIQTFGVPGVTAGGAITTLAEAAATKAPGEALRLSIYNNGFINYPSISASNPKLQGMTELITVLALISEILAESIGSDGILHQTNYVAGPAACLAAGAVACALTAACDAPASSVLTTGTTPDFSASPAAAIATNQPSGSPSLDMLLYAVNAGTNAVNLLGTGGTVSSISAVFTALYQGGALPSASAAFARCFRFQMVSNNIGI